MQYKTTRWYQSGNFYDERKQHTQKLYYLQRDISAHISFQKPYTWMVFLLREVYLNQQHINLRRTGDGTMDGFVFCQLEECNRCTCSDTHAHSYKHKYKWEWVCIRSCAILQRVFTTYRAGEANKIYIYIQTHTHYDYCETIALMVRIWSVEDSTRKNLNAHPLIVLSFCQRYKDRNALRNVLVTVLPPDRTVLLFNA